ncbi:MAG: 1-acyl-sn-glycerol-3-phosphate acyltransferase [Ruminococcaceae bacterium]|nr:1-acyl-sn-glycerol-3-phosphate acyltransferase [Oscillospiraceae bacterium]
MKQTTKKNKKRFKSYTIWTFFYDFIRFTGVIPTWIYLRPKIIKKGKKQKKVKGAIMMANHIGLLDPVVLQFVFAPRRMWTLAMSELFDKPLKRFFFKSALCIPVDRENVTIDMYHSVSDVLKANKILAMFPEGRINFDEIAEVKKFKGGVALFAILNRVPVIPVYIVKREKWYQRQRIVVGEPIYLDEALGRAPTPADIEKVSELLHEKEEELALQYDSKYSKAQKEKENAESIKS